MWRRADIRVRIRPKLSAGHLLQSVGNGLDLRKSPGAPGMTVEGFTVGNAPLFDYDILTVSVPRTTVDYRWLAFGIGFGIKLG